MNRMEAAYVVALTRDNIYPTHPDLDVYFDSMVFFLSTSNLLLLGDADWQGSITDWRRIVPMLRSLQTRSRTLLRSSPSWMPLASNLETIDLASSNLYKLPPALLGVKNLRRLYVDRNPLREIDIVFQMDLTDLEIAHTKLGPGYAEAVIAHVRGNRNRRVKTAESDNRTSSRNLYANISGRITEFGKDYGGISTVRRLEEKGAHGRFMDGLAEGIAGGIK